VLFFAYSALIGVFAIALALAVSRWEPDAESRG